MPANKIIKPVQQFGYQWHTPFAGQTINKHNNMGKILALLKQSHFNLNLKI